MNEEQKNSRGSGYSAEELSERRWGFVASFFFGLAALGSTLLLPTALDGWAFAATGALFAVAVMTVLPWLDGRVPSKIFEDTGGL